ncbi:MAG TPA: winged helix-turn-helix domain-containing protein [Pyrinomonadaceae bacterium]|nr:winged helix-turn-helix domain-containing protein [Pyrinomonadaceae bacterium]
MENSKQTTAQVQCFDNVAIDRSNFRVRKGEELKALTPRAFDVLTYLIDHRGRVVEKQELFEKIWKETFVSDNALTRAVKEIRRELGDDAGAPRYIETVHKRGYRFIAELKDVPADRLDSEAAPEAAISPASIELGNQPTQGPAVTRLKTPKVVAALVFAALVIVVAAIIYFARTEKAIHSLAVLPLENASADASKDYMSDGITENLINSLSQLPQLKVIPRTTAFRYKGQQIDPQKVGRDLGVDAVLTGRIIQQGDDLIVQAELTNTADGSQRWGGRYSRKVADVFVLQEEIAREISNKLRLKLTGEDEKRLTRRYTDNAEAYELYLKGRYHLNKLTPPEVQISVSYFQQAIVIDRSYALAYVGLAAAYHALALSVDMPSTEFFPKSKAAALQAIEIDEGLAEAHAVLGFAILFYDWDWASAENQFKRALTLSPNSADSHFSYAGFLAVLGRHDEALTEIKRAREIDPLDLRVNTLEGQFLILAGHTDEGLTRLQKTIELEPNYFLAHLFAANAYIEKGMYTEAVTEATSARDLSGGNAEAIATIGYALAKSGRPDKARIALEQLKNRSAERYVPPYNFALIHNGLGEHDEALAWLDRGVEQRDPKMLFLRGRAQWNNLRDDQRFQNLLRRIGFNQ